MFERGFVLKCYEFLNTHTVSMSASIARFRSSGSLFHGKRLTNTMVSGFPKMGYRVGFSSIRRLPDGPSRPPESFEAARFDRKRFTNTMVSGFPKMGYRVGFSSIRRLPDGPSRPP
ncbi:MAG: hypothetical protein ACI814_004633, partial [Mariniblastus sp.]